LPDHDRNNNIIGKWLKIPATGNLFFCTFAAVKTMWENSLRQFLRQCKYKGTVKYWELI